MLYCSAGGKRSKYMSAILKMAKFDSNLLKGGYSAYRKFVKDFLLEETALKTVEQFRYIAVTGPPCKGKSQFLNKLTEHGEQILNLEEMAALNEPFLEDKSFPTQQYFQSKIFQKLALELKTTQVVWVVYERSCMNNLGRVFKT